MENIQWYPGHMTRAKRQMQEDLKLVDLVIELADARVPESSRNPDIAELCAGKPRILVLNKADLADPAVTEAYSAAQQQKGVRVIAANARSKGTVQPLLKAVSEVCAAKREHDRKRGILNRPVRAMVAGIPNVGKSTLINSLSGRSSAKTGDKPGVTKGKQWIALPGGLLLLDTPGILWPKFEDPQTGMRLAVTGAIADTAADPAELALWLISWLQAYYPGILESRYGAEGKTFEKADGPGRQVVLSELAAARNFVKKGSEPDRDRMAAVLLDDFRAGKTGRVSLERM